MAKKFFPISADAMAVLKPASTGSGGSLGAGKDWHINVGRTGNYVSRGVLKFNLDFTGMTSISSATLYMKTAASTLGTLSGYNRDTHTVPNAGTMKIYRITKSWSEGTYGNDEIWYGANPTEWSTFATGSTDASVNTLTGVDTGSVITTANTTTSRSTITSYDITNHIRAWAPTNVPVNGTNGSAATNYGILLKMPTEAVDAGNLDSIEFYSREAYAYSTTYGAGNGGNTNAAEWVGGVAGASAYIEVTYTSISNPTGTPTDPASNGLAQIINLDDTTEWTDSGQHARPRLEWSYTSGGGGAQTRWRVRIYSDGSKTATYYDTGWVSDGSHSSDLYFDVPTNAAAPAWLTGATGYVGWSTISGLVNGTAYYWTIQVEDPLGNQSSESATTAFKVRWGQAIHNWDAGGSNTSGWSITHSAIPTDTQIATFYRAVTTTTTNTGSWTDDIGPITGTQRYLQTLTRLSTNVSGTKPYITDMTFSYISDAVSPDNWVYNASTLILDANERRFGTKSALWTATGTGAASAQPLRNTGEYDLKVLHNTKYTFSAYIKPKKTDGTSTIGTRQVKLRVFKSTGLTSSATGMTEIATSDNYALFEADNEGWYRLTLTFTTDGSTDYVKPLIYLYGTGSVGDYLYLDGVQFEEGTVVRSWTPGFVTQAVTIEGGGISLDASKGAALRLRGSSAGTRDVIEIGEKGLTFGGATNPANLYSPDEHVLASDKQIRSYYSPAFRAETSASADTAFRSLAAGDTYGRLNIRTDGVLDWGTGAAAADTNLYRSQANVLKTDDSLWIAGNVFGTGATVYDREGSADSTVITTANTMQPLTSSLAGGSGFQDVTFTPQFVGQRWLMTYTGYASINTTTIQYIFIRCSITDASANIVDTNFAFTRAENFGTTSRGMAVAMTKVWVADTTDTRKFKLYGTTQTTSGLTLSMSYGQLHAIPLG